jgi:uncharacterized RDD family membrane protein YckC
MVPHYVGFWARVLASLVDSLLMLLLLVPLGMLFFLDELMAGQEQLDSGINALINYVLPIAIVLAFWVYKSATPGKMMLKAIIVDADTLQKPEMWQWIVRYLGYYVSGLLLMLGFLWVAWDPRKQGFHDKLARTVVIYADRGATSASQPDQSMAGE